MSERQTHTPEDARRRLGIGRTRFYEMLHSNEIPHIKNGSRFLIPVAAIDKLLSGKNAAKET